MKKRRAVLTGLLVPGMLVAGVTLGSSSASAATTKTETRAICTTVPLYGTAYSSVHEVTVTLTAPDKIDPADIFTVGYDLSSAPEQGPIGTEDVVVDDTRTIVMGTGADAEVDPWLGEVDGPLNIPARSKLPIPLKASAETASSQIDGKLTISAGSYGLVYTGGTNGFEDAETVCTFPADNVPTIEVQVGDVVVDDDPADTDTDTPTDDAGGGTPAEDTAGGELANTGTSPTTWMIAGIALLLLQGGLVLTVRAVRSAPRRIA